MLRLGPGEVLEFHDANPVCTLLYCFSAVARSLEGFLCIILLWLCKVLQTLSIVPLLHLEV